MQENQKNIDLINRMAEDMLMGKKPPDDLDPTIVDALKKILAKKTAPIDLQFKKQLDKKINSTLNNLHKQHHFNFFKHLSMKYLLTFLTGTFVAAILAVVILNATGVWAPFSPKQTQQSENQIQTMQFEPNTVSDVSNEDFGSIPALNESGSATPAAQDASLQRATSEKMAIMPPYSGGDLYPPEVNYNYQGATMNIPQNVAIFKAVPTTLSSAAIKPLIRVFGTALGNMIQDEEINMQNLGFISKDNMNYNFDFGGGQFNFYTNRDLGPNPKQPEEKDILQDAALIDIANKYLKTKNIDITMLNTPQVEDQWKIYYAQEKSANPYIPREMSVIYPLTLDDIKVVNFGGNNEAQIRLNIDILDKIVVSGSILLTLNMQRTEFAAQNGEIVMEILKKTGGTNAFWYAPRPLAIDVPGGAAEDLKPETIDVNYNQAELVYLQKYDWKPTGPTIFYIPAAMFKGQAINSGQEEPYDSTTFVPIISSEEFKK